MRINWQARLKSYPFWVALLSFIGLILVDAGIVTTGTFDTYVKAFLGLLVAGGVITDPSTPGISDKERDDK